MILLLVMLQKKQHADFFYPLQLSESDLSASIKNLAQSMRDVDKVGSIPKVKKNLKVIKSAHDLIENKIVNNKHIYEYEKWIYENYNWVKLNVKPSDYRSFATLPHKKNQIRVLTLARMICSATKFNFSEEVLLKSITEFNRYTPLKISEIMAFKEAFALAAAERLAMLSTWCIKDNAMEKNAKKSDRPIEKYLSDERYLFHYKSCGRAINTNYFYRHTELNIHAIDLTYNNSLVENSILSANSINLIKKLGDMFSAEFLIKLSPIFSDLNSDKVFKNMDTSSKISYFFAVEKLSKLLKINESSVVKAAFDLAEKHDTHFGNILFDYRYAIKTHIYNTAPNSLKKPSTAFDQRTFIAIVWTIDLLISVIVSVLTQTIWLKIVLGISVIFTAFPLAEYIATKIFSLILPQRAVHKMSYEKLPDEAKTLVVVCNFITSKEQAKTCYESVLTRSLAEKDKNIAFCMLVDLKKSKTQENTSDKEIFEFFDSIDSCKLSILIRKREKISGGYGGFERKRGAICELNKSLIKGEFEGFSYVRNIPEKPQFVVTLDDDTTLAIGAVKSAALTMIHPHNENVALLTFECRTLLSSIKNKFSEYVAGESGVESYCAYGNFIYNLSGKSVFCGKGIYRLESFYNQLEGKIPMGKVLSHDIIEGAIVGSAALDLPCYEDSPSSFSSFVSRANRWLRGDLLLGRFLFSKNISAPIFNFVIYSNIIKSVVCIGNFVMLMLLLITQNLIILLPLIISLALCPTLRLLFSTVENASKIKPTHRLKVIANIFIESLFMAALLPFWTLNNLYIIAKTCFYSIFKKEKVLEWKTFYEVQNSKSGSAFLKIVSGSVVMMTAIAAIFYGNYYVLGYTLLFFIALLAKYIMQNITIDGKKRVSKKDKEYLMQIAKKTSLYFDETELSGKLTCDNIQITPKNLSIKITSPSNIGFGLISKICKYKLSLCTIEECKSLLKKQLEVIAQLKKWNGHLYNWYGVDNCEEVGNGFISSVDSGNFAACLYVVLSFCKQEKFAWEEAQTREILAQMDFQKLFNTEKKLYAIGFNTKENKLIGAYDMLASESRLMTYIANCKNGDMSSWRNLSRTHARAGGGLLVSWSGTAFEYLLPQIFLPDTHKSLITTSVKRFCKVMKKTKCCKLWGISESGYYNFDNNMNYQYHAFGLSNISLKAQLNRCVISPYSSVLALQYCPKDAIKNLKKIENDGGFGQYGMCEAIDFTNGKKIVDSYMSHHQGMIIATIANFLCDDCIKKMFWNNRILQTGKLALQEKATIFKAQTLKKQEFVYDNKTEFGIYEKENVNIQKLKIAAICAGKTSFVTDSLGNSYTKINDIIINRYKFDPYINSGSYVYINDGAEVFSPTFAPLRNKKNEYTFSNTHHDCVFENVTKACSMQVFVSEQSECIIKKISFSNLSDVQKKYKIAFCEQLSLATFGDDSAHPSFNDMFIEIELDSEINTLIAHRKQRARSGDLYCGMQIKGLEKFEPVCNLYNFVGRCRDFDNPQIFEKNNFDCTNLGDVLYPCFGFVGEVTLNGGESRHITLITKLSEEKEDLKKLFVATSENHFEDYAFEGARLTMLSISKKYLKNVETYQYFQKLAATIMYKNYSYESLQRAYKLEQPLPLGLEKNKKFVLYPFDGNDQLLQMLISSCVYANLVGIKFDLVIAYDEADDYYQITKERLIKATGISDLYSLPFIKFFVGTKINVKSFEMLKTFAFFVASEPLEDIKFGLCSVAILRDNLKFARVPRQIDLASGSGGFDSDGNYIVEQIPRLCYSNVVCLEEGGFVATENGGGFIYNKNSYSNKLTNWDNQVVFDRPSEEIYLSLGGEFLRINKLNCDGYVKHKIGETEYMCLVNGILISLRETIIDKGLGKVWTIDVKNNNSTNIPITVLFKITPILSNSWNKAMIFDEKISKNTMRIASAASCQEMFLTCDKPCEMPKDYAAIGDLASKKISGIGVGKSDFYNPSHTMTFDKVVMKNSSEEINFILSTSYATACVAQDKDELKLRLNITREHYTNLSPISIKTSDKTLDILFNKWLFYQVESSRLCGKCAYYQVGGAVGFRDQLQDCLAMLYKNPDFVRSHICICAEHQYIEGDVMHWWHKPRFGVRTRISDDKLFLVYLTYEYVKFTGDKSILNEKIAYLVGEPLLPMQEARLEYGKLSEVKQSLLGHLKSAVDSALNYGKHGLLLIGSGDWNDALNDIGIKESGESVWLTMFAVDTITKLAEFVDEESAKEYQTIVEKLKIALSKTNLNGYYARACTDDGEWLGVKESKYMSIDLLSQSFATISKIGTEESRQRCLQIAGARLVDAENRIIKLLDPPFQKDKYYGYISSYPSGVRENGGQYTHAAVWYVKACAEAKQVLVADKLLKMLNPISRCEDEKLNKAYMGEPYVLPADIYTNKFNYGRMGWSWYTGSASWLYDTIVKDFFCIKICGKSISFKQPIIENWENASLKFFFEGTIYNICFASGKQNFLKIGEVNHYGGMTYSMTPNQGNINITAHFAKIVE